MYLKLRGKFVASTNCLSTDSGISRLGGLWILRAAWEADHLVLRNRKPLGGAVPSISTSRSLKCPVHTDFRTLSVSAVLNLAIIIEKWFSWDTNSSTAGMNKQYTLAKARCVLIVCYAGLQGWLWYNYKRGLTTYMYSGLEDASLLSVFAWNHHSIMQAL